MFTTEGPGLPGWGGRRPLRITAQTRSNDRGGRCRRAPPPPAPPGGSAGAERPARLTAAPGGQLRRRHRPDPSPPPQPAPRGPATSRGLPPAPGSGGQGVPRSAAGRLYREPKCCGGDDLSSRRAEPSPTGLPALHRQEVPSSSVSCAKMRLLGRSRGGGRAARLRAEPVRFAWTTGARGAFSTEVLPDVRTARCAYLPASGLRDGEAGLLRGFLCNRLRSTSGPLLTGKPFKKTNEGI